MGWKRRAVHRVSATAAIKTVAYRFLASTKASGPDRGAASRSVDARALGREGLCARSIVRRIKAGAASFKMSKSEA